MPWLPGAPIFVRAHRMRCVTPDADAALVVPRYERLRLCVWTYYPVCGVGGGGRAGGGHGRGHFRHSCGARPLRTARPRPVVTKGVDVACRPPHIMVPCHCPLKGILLFPLFTHNVFPTCATTQHPLTCRRCAGGGPCMGVRPGCLGAPPGGGAQHRLPGGRAEGHERQPRLLSARVRAGARSRGRGALYTHTPTPAQRVRGWALCVGALCVVRGCTVRCAGVSSAFAAPWLCGGLRALAGV
jgi:hypothetical protein